MTDPNIHIVGNDEPVIHHVPHPGYSTGNGHAQKNGQNGHGVNGFAKGNGHAATPAHPSIEVQLTTEETKGMLERDALSEFMVHIKDRLAGHRITEEGNGRLAIVTTDKDPQKLLTVTPVKENNGLVFARVDFVGKSDRLQIGDVEKIAESLCKSWVEKVRRDAEEPSRGFESVE